MSTYFTEVYFRELGIDILLILQKGINNSLTRIKTNPNALCIFGAGIRHRIQVGMCIQRSSQSVFG